MPIYHTLGQVPKKRHTVFRRPDGGLYAEELMGHEEFVGTSSLLYHSYPPTTVKSARRIREVKWEPDEIDAHCDRNAQADECVYVAEGSGVLESVYGDLPFMQGDYVVNHRNIL